MFYQNPKRICFNFNTDLFCKLYSKSSFRSKKGTQLFITITLCTSRVIYLNNQHQETKRDEVLQVRTPPTTVHSTGGLLGRREGLGTL